MSRPNLRINMVFENLFRIDPIMSELSMTPILEENSSEGRKLFKKNGTNSGKYNPPPSSSASTCSSSSSGGTSGTLGSSSSFVRSGSSKSYAKNRRPLSRLWQMRRRSFSQFELHSVDTLLGIGIGGGNGASGNEFVPLGGNGSCTEIDADNAGTSGFFHPIGDDFWSSETDLTACSSSFNRNSRYAGSQRVTGSNSDDYGFLPRARHHSSSHQPSSLQIFPSLSGGHPNRNSSNGTSGGSQGQTTVKQIDGEGSFVRGGYRRSSTKYKDRVSRSDAQDDDDRDDPAVDDHPNFVNNNKALPRSHSGMDAQSVNRKQRKPSKKSQNVVCDRDGRGQGPHQHQHQHHDNNPFPLFNNRSLSMLSTMHHLNPHRKVAMSPEILREAEEKACSLRKAVKQLQEQLEKTNREKARIHRFLSDLLYTLNARGYESVRDHEGTLVDLNKCKGDAYLDLKGRDLKQRVNVRRPGGQEIYLKAIIGNQERAIQSLVFRLDSIGRDMVLGNRLSVDDTISSQERAKIASLESEVLQLVNLIEGACQKCPDIYQALRDQYYLSETIECIDLSPRNPVLQNILKKCEQIAGEAQSRQLVEMLTNSSLDQRPRSQQSSKSTKTRPVSKPKTASHLQKTPRPATSENPPQINTVRPILDNMKNVDCVRGGETRYSTHATRGTETDTQLRRLNGQSKSENNFHNKDVSANFSRSSSPSTSGGEPLATYHSKSRADHAYEDNNLTVCMYCSRRFGIEESISEIKNHIEMHIFAGDTTL